MQQAHIGSIVSIVDRMTKFALFVLLPDRTAGNVTTAITDAMKHAELTPQITEKNSPNTPKSPESPARPSTSPNPISRGSAASTNTPTDCCGNISPKEPTSQK